MRPPPALLAVCAACAACVLAATLAQAAPAPWYKWRSRIDGYLACAQTSLGPGWVRDSGPYKDSRCEKLVLAK
jgi:hypothetical protein